MENGRFGKLGLIISNSVPSWGQDVAKNLDLTPMDMNLGFFPNKELRVERNCDVRGMDICILSSLHSHYNTVKELKLICNTINGASRIFGVFPFVCDGKSDHKKKFGDNIAYKVTAMDISQSGVETIVIFDQHSSQHPGFYDTTNYRLRDVHHVYLMKILIEHAMKISSSFDSVLALDAGSFGRNDKIAELLDKDVAFILKRRHAHTRDIDFEKTKIIGDIEGKRIASFDDMIQEAGTLKTGAMIAKNKGAKEFHFFFVHTDFSDKTFDTINPLLENGLIDKIYTLETIPVPNKEKWHKNMIFLSPAKLIVDVIKTIHTEGHMRKHFLEI